MRGYGASQAGLGLNGVEHFREFMHDFVVQEPEDEPAEALDLALANQIVAGLRVAFMDAAVEFDDKAGLLTGKIGEVAVDRMLTNELQTLKTAAADRLPEPSFGKGLALAKLM